MIPATEIESALDQFHGTEFYYQFNPLVPRCYLTEGSRYLARAAEAYWLMDLIASYQRDHRLESQWFQVWRLKKIGEGAIIRCEDGNGGLILTQTIELTDFPLSEATLWAAREGGRDSFDTIIHLPSEH